MNQSLVGKNILVLGAYGFIGASVVRALREDGAKVTGLVRDRATGARVLPDVDLIVGDLRAMQHVGAWDEVLDSIDIVVNCAGALQDNRLDDLEAIHHTAVSAMAEACAQHQVGIVQISAIGATRAASTLFMRSKAAGDAALQASGVPLWVLKPGLVIGVEDYGGTALLRMLAAVPLVQPIAYPNTPVQSVGMEDLCQAVVAACRGSLPHGTYELVEDDARPLAFVVAQTRHWLGFPKAWFSVPVPRFLVRAIASCADQLSRLGWRSPLRSTAMTVMEHGVTGDPEAYKRVTGRSVSDLSRTYSRLTASRTHRQSARLSVLTPLLIAVLSLFWVLSGLFGLIGLGKAAGILTSSGWTTLSATGAVVFWSLVDIALGLALLWRPWAVRVCLAQAGVCALYLLGASVLVPALWLDPLGPLVKIVPVMMLSLILSVLLEKR